MNPLARSKQLKLTLIFGVVFAAITIFHLAIDDGKAFERRGSKSYGILANALVTNYQLAPPDEPPSASRPPLYPLFLAGVLWLAGHLQWAITAQSLLTGLTLGFLALITFIYTGKIWPIVAMSLLYVYLKEIVEELLKQRETGLFAALLVISCFVFIQQEKKYRWWKVAVLGVLMGLACLTRPLALIGLFFAGLWAMRLYAGGLTPAQIGRRLAIFLAAFYLVLLPWGIRNWFALNKFIISSTTSGVNLWKGNNPGTADFYPMVDVDVLDDLLKNPPPEPGWWDGLRDISQLSEIEKNQRLRQLGQSYIIEQPATFFKMGLIKLYALWAPHYHPLGSGNPKWVADGAELVDFDPHHRTLAPYLLLYFLGGIGFWALHRTAYSWFFLTWVIFLSIIHFITFGESRFRWPINLLALPMAATGCYLLGIKLYAYGQRLLKQS